MRKVILAGFAILIACLWIAGDSLGRGGRGGRVGGGGDRFRGTGGGFGGANAGLRGISGQPGAVSNAYRGGGASGFRSKHFNAGRTPSMARPTGLPSSLTRPMNSGVARTPNTRPAHGNLPIPSGPGLNIASLPKAGGAAGRPGTARPSTGERPATGGRIDVATRPSTGVPTGNRAAQRYADLSGGISNSANIGGSTAARAIGSRTAGNGQMLAGGAAAQFLQDQPITSLLDIKQLPSGNFANVGGPKGAGSVKDLVAERPNGLRPSQSPAASAAERVQNLAQHRPNRITDRNQWNDWIQDNRGAVLAYMRNHAGDDDWFDEDWWLYRKLQDLYPPTFSYWAPAAWPALSGWVDSSWNEPIPYNYGSNVYYQDGDVYYGDQRIATEQEYAEQAEAIASNLPASKPAESDWMPLGVFALTSNGKPTGAEPTMFLQLAISKQGVISGTFQNTATGTTQAVQGMTDRQTQRAAWSGVEKSRPLMETGIVNLTQDSAPALIHFADGTTQQWLLVRLDQPSGAETTENIR